MCNLSLISLTKQAPAHLTVGSLRREGRVTKEHLKGEWDVPPKRVVEEQLAGMQSTWFWGTDAIGMMHSGELRLVLGYG